MKRLLFVIFIIIAINNLYCHDLSGVWFVQKRSDMTAGDGYGSGTWFYPYTVSWGTATVHQGALLIDCEVLPSYTIFFHIDQIKATITSLVKENENTYLMTVSRGGLMTSNEDKPQYERYRLYILSEGRMCISALTPDRNIALQWTDNNYILYRNDKPPVDYVFFPTHYTTENLRLRDYPDLIRGKVIITMPKNTGIKILYTSVSETIDGIVGNWVKIVSENNYIGWCFSGYLRE